MAGKCAARILSTVAFQRGGPTIAVRHVVKIVVKHYGQDSGQTSWSTILVNPVMTRGAGVQRVPHGEHGQDAHGGLRLRLLHRHQAPQARLGPRTRTRTRTCAPTPTPTPIATHPAPPAHNTAAGLGPAYLSLSLSLARSRARALYPLPTAKPPARSPPLPPPRAPAPPRRLRSRGAPRPPSPCVRPTALAMPARWEGAGGAPSTPPRPAARARRWPRLALAAPRPGG
jgi:hypothetical protein